MMLLDKIKTLLFTLLFSYSFIYPETLEDFAKALDLVFLTQEKIGEEKKIKEVDIKIEGSKETTQSFIEKLNSDGNIEILSIYLSNEIDFNSPKIPWNRLVNIKKLRLSNLKIDNNVLKKFINNCLGIEKLILSNCENITEEDFKNIAWSKLSNLKELILPWANINDDGLEKISENCEKLETLDLFSCKKITENGLKKISDGCEQLKKLVLHWCENISEEGFKNITWSKFSSLKKLDLSSSNINKDGLNKILDSCEKLETLNLSSCKKILKEDFKNITWSKLSSLKKLGLFKTNINKDGLNKIVENCKELEKLDLSECKIAEEDFKNIAWVNLSMLKKLDLSSTSINDDGLKKISENCKKLETLNLSSCENISEDGFKNIAWGNLSMLKKLYLSNTRINKDGLNKIVENCKKLEILDLYWCTSFSLRGYRKEFKSREEIKEAFESL